MKASRKKLLSIIVPVFNTSNFLRRCLNSLLFNKYRDDLEIIIIDDGSEDNSYTLMCHYNAKYPGIIKVLKQQNSGHGTVIDKGIALAKGKYFKVVDSDDYLDTNKFETFIDLLKVSDEDLILTNYSREYLLDDKSINYRYKNLVNNRSYLFDTFDLNLLNKEYFTLASSTYKTQLLRKSKVQHFKNTYYVDMQFNTLPIISLNNFKYLDLNLYKYFIGRSTQSITTMSMVKHKNDHKKVICSLLLDYKNKITVYSENKRKYIENIIELMLVTHYSIYIEYDENKIQSAKSIRVFDNFLKNNYFNFYSKTNKYSKIKLNRKYFFIPTYFNDLVDKLVFIKNRLFKRHG